MKNKEKNFASAVIYIHNNDARVEDFLQVVTAFFQDCFEKSEIICVDDFSADQSVKRIRKFACKQTNGSTNITVLNMGYFHGNEKAMDAGIALSIGDFIFEFDSVEWRLREADMYDAYKKALEGYDIVCAAPDVNTDALTDIFYWLLNSRITVAQKIGTEAFRVLSRRALNRIYDMNHVVSYRKVDYAKSGLKIYRKILKISKYGSRNDRQERKYRWKLAVNVIFIHTDLILRGSTCMTLISFSVMFLGSIYGILQKAGILWQKKTRPERIFSTAAGTAFFGLLTAVIKYQTMILKNIYKQKEYGYMNIEKLTN